jgi:PAS domain S-box-containing protein
MNYFDYQDLIQRAQFGYACHEILIDQAGNPYDYRFLEVNSSFEKLTGLESSKIIGKTARSVLPGIENSAFNWIAFYGRVALDGGNETFEQFSEPLNRWYNVQVYSPRTNLFATVFVDVTSQHDLSEASSQLNKFTIYNIDYQYIVDRMAAYSGARYATLNKFDSSGTNFTTVAIAGLTKQMEKAVQLLGFPLLGKNWEFDPVREAKIRNSKTTFFKHLEDLTGKVLGSGIIKKLSEISGMETLAIVKTVQDGLMVGDFTLVFKKNQKMVNQSFVESYADMVGILLGRINAEERMAKDIENRRLVEEELRKRNQFIQTVLDNLPIGVALNEITKGNAFYLNKKFEEIYGWPAEELLDISSFFKKVYPDENYRKELTERVMADIQSGDPSRMHWENIRVTGKDGTQRFVNTVNIPLIDQNIMVSTVSDITEQKRTEAELIAAKGKAEESDRLKTAFLANMSHEIRTPMNGILGFTELLKEPKLSGEEQQKYISIIEQSGDRLLNIINDIISLSKIESGHSDVTLSETNINDQLEYLHTFFKPEALSKGIRLSARTGKKTDKALIRTDKEKLYAILTNLIKNALKFTKEGEIKFGYQVKGSSILFFVQDTGDGIPKEQKEFIFERFRQGSTSMSRSYEGAGLGLAISKGYVEMLGGKIWVESEEGKGSTFFFTIN